MPDTFITLWNRLQLRAPDLGPALAQDLIRDALNQLAERRPWSWLAKTGAFYPPALYNTGTVSVTQDLNTVTGALTAFTAAMVGRQFRIGVIYPTYTITAVTGATSLVLDKPWTGPTLVGQGYSIFRSYYEVPSDFNYFKTIVNLSAFYRLHHNGSQELFDQYDPQRTLTTQAWAAAFLDFSTNLNGTVDSVLQVHGAGPAPISTTTNGYSFPADSTYIIEIDTGGAVGVCTFKWQQDSGASTALVAVPDSNPIDLTNGVQIYFPAGVYVLGDVFIVNCHANKVTGVPRYEFWPRTMTVQHVYNYIYQSRIPELTDDKPELPSFIRGDVILEMALGHAASVKRFGDRDNSYYDLVTARRHDARAEKMIAELELRDDDVRPQDLRFSTVPWANIPWLDGDWRQTHAIFPFG